MNNQGVRLLWVGDRVMATIGMGVEMPATYCGEVKEVHSTYVKVRWDGHNHLASHRPELLQIMRAPEREFFESDEVSMALMDQ